MLEYDGPQELMDELDREIFVSLNDELLFEGDGIKTRPLVNFVEVKTDKLSSGDKRFLETVSLYLDIRYEIDKLLNRYPRYSDEYYNCWFSISKKAAAWDPSSRDIIFFILPEAEAENFKRLKTETLSFLCEVYQFHFVVRRRYSEFLDLETGSVYELNCDEIPGMCDDAATYYEYCLSVTHPDQTIHVIWSERET